MSRGHSCFQISDYGRVQSPQMMENVCNASYEGLLVTNTEDLACVFHLVCVYFVYIAVWL